MLNVLDAFANITNDCKTVISNPLCSTRDLLTVLKLNFKDILVRRKVLKTKQETIRGVEFNAPTYGSILSLWREVYGESPYYFEPNLRILDVGSNIGISVLYFKSLYPNARITAFEPDETARQLLLRNIERNHLDVEVIPKAAAAYNGTLTWHFDRSKPESLSMSAVRVDLPDKAEVECVRLSGFVTERIDFLKLDIEGSEGDVLAELRDSGKLQLIQQMAIEYHPWGTHKLEAILDILKPFNVTVEQKEGPRMIFCRQPTA